MNLQKKGENVLSDNDVSKIDFSFLLYANFVDKGTGCEIEVENCGDLGFTHNRKGKQWYSRIFYRKVMRLKEILTEKFRNEVARQILFSMSPDSK